MKSTVRSSGNLASRLIENSRRVTTSLLGATKSGHIEANVVNHTNIINEMLSGGSLARFVENRLQ